MSYAETIPTTNGVTTEFTLLSTMEYTNASQIQVILDGTTQTQGDVDDNEDYYLTGTESTGFPSGNTVKMTVAPGASSRLLIRRVTSLTAPAVDWSDASTISEADHDKQDKTGLWRDQELADQQGMSKDPETGHWDAETLKITEAVDPTNLQDVATKAYVDGIVSGTQPLATGIYRFQYTGDGSTDEFRVVSSGDGALTDKSMILLFRGNEFVPEDQYELKATDGEIVQFDTPPGQDVPIETIVKTIAFATFLDGSIAVEKIVLSEDFLITGNSSGEGSGITRATITLDEWGGPVTSVDMSGEKLINLGTPAAATDGATKAYVDAIPDPLDPFDAMGGLESYTFNSSGVGEIITNVNSYTQLIHFLIKTPSSQNSKKFYAMLITGTRVVAYAMVPTTGSPGVKYASMTFAVPTGETWRVVEVDGSDISAWTDVKFRRASSTTL